MKHYNEYAKLIDYLTSNKIDFTYKSILGLNDGINIPCCDNMSVVFYKYSYGYEQGNVEVLAVFCDDVIGDLTCAKVINIINNYKRLKQARADSDKACSESGAFIYNVVNNVSDVEENENDR